MIRSSENSYLGVVKKILASLLVSIGPDVLL